MVYITALMIEIGAAIDAGGASSDSDARRLALRATKWIPDDALAEALCERFAMAAQALGFFSELTRSIDPELRQDALDVLREIEDASRVT